MNRTFTIIKPDSMRAGVEGKIIDILLSRGFRIAAMRATRLSEQKAGEFYAIHKEKPFFGELMEYMTSGQVIVAVLERDDAVAELRRTVGATNPQKAEPGTIRAMFGTDVTMNAIHASDSDENAKIEAAHFFSEEDYCL
ncbi:MAG: nucleoside-diphosphate kinase [Tidjanibacter sp.]|nr:nucleoside-diphosphate kinase [Tidjanibacter sp.]MBR4064100.1 nucleoside-diphosphate kinase [Tidjanibacter sp.]MBR6813498.1 nucleoside-diphosphate kinase [Tidjanibacter sp.]